MKSSQTLSPKDREDIKSINNSGEDLLKLINNILSFTKTEVETINPNFDQEIYVDTQTNLKTFNLTAETFSGMSLEWIEQLYQAISSLDEPLIFSLIEKIPPEKQELSEELKYWVNHFRFDLIFNILENMIQKS
ncbi:MAG: hypothetical protein RSE13_14725 [Planktothrix sp. GU0601_MAG3]|nr:MAG: hypothetical protein RSE13_14725 [Planktothrix sp. GU0601_MAG3]